MSLKVTGTRQLFTAPKGEKGDKGEDGNSFTPKGQAYGHFNSYQDWETAISNGQIQTAVPYLVDNAGYEHALVCYKYGHGNGSRTSEDGDAWTIISTKHLWAAVGDSWVDFGEIQGPPGEDGQDGNDGNDAELYQLLMTEAWARWEYDSSNNQWVLKCCIKGEAWFIKGGNRVSATSGLNYENQRIRIKYNNGKEIHYANIAGDGTWVDGYEGTYMQDDVYGESRVGQPKSIIVDLIGKDISDSTTVLDSKTIAIVWDGTPGGKGNDGNPGPMGIPAGTYSSIARYERTSSIVPIVENNGKYWYPKNVGVISGVEPSSDANSPWGLVPEFEVFFIKILFAAFAKVGEAIFHGNFMFSQNGKVNGAASNNYQLFTPSDPDNEANASRFAPNLYLNFLTGAARLAAGKAKFFADGSGFLAGGNIEWDISGIMNYSGVTKRKKTIVTDANFNQFLESGYLDPEDETTYWEIFHVERCGIYIELQNVENHRAVFLPDYFAVSSGAYDRSSDMRDRAEYCRSLLGNKIVMVNRGRSSLTVYGIRNTSIMSLGVGCVGVFECKLTDRNGAEYISWDYITTNF